MKPHPVLGVHFQRSWVLDFSSGVDSLDKWVGRAVEKVTLHEFRYHLVVESSSF